MNWEDLTWRQFVLLKEKLSGSIPNVGIDLALNNMLTEKPTKMEHIKTYVAIDDTIIFPYFPILCEKNNKFSSPHRASARL